MKKLIALAILFVGCCIAQNSDADFPAAARIFFSDGTDVQLSCTQDGLCQVMRNTSTSPIVTRVNLGFSAKHGYTLLVK